MFKELYNEMLNLGILTNFGTGNSLMISNLNHLPTSPRYWMVRGKGSAAVGSRARDRIVNGPVHTQTRGKLTEITDPAIEVLTIKLVRMQSFNIL